MAAVEAVRAEQHTQAALTSQVRTAAAQAAAETNAARQAAAKAEAEAQAARHLRGKVESTESRANQQFSQRTEAIQKEAADFAAMQRDAVITEAEDAVL